MNAREFDFNEDIEKNGESSFDLTCPNIAHHKKYGVGWETEYESTITPDGKKCEPYKGCPYCMDDTGRIQIANYYIHKVNKCKMPTDTRLMVLKDTECAIIQEITSGDWYIALTTSGMDLSHEIVRAYQIIGEYVPLYILDGFYIRNLKHVISDEKVEVIRQHVLDSALYYENVAEDVLNEWSQKPIQTTA